jgi:hypothetical protein
MGCSRPGSIEENMLDEKVTILIPTSPIKSHPDTGIISFVLDSCRFHFPLAKILILMDGVRPEQSDYKSRYKEYCNRIHDKCANDWRNVVPMDFGVHCHQVGMTREALSITRTPLILFVEHDTPIVTDEPIEWTGIVKTVLDGTANMVRLLHEAAILKAHQHLTLETVTYNDVRFTKTLQWSQRPHIARADFYREMLAEYFSPDANSMIEDRMHGACQDQPWEYSKMLIYNPNDTNIKRSYHTDGREGDEKFEMRF